MRQRTMRMLSILLALCMALALLPGTAWAATADSGTCGDNLTWVLDSDGTLTISGTGAMIDYSPLSMPWYNQRDAITGVVIGSGVTSIGGRAFDSCSSLTSVTIPDSVTTIGPGAFSYCFRLTSVIIPNSVTTIGSSAFQDCASLTNVTIPNRITTIGYGTFMECHSLTSVTIPNSATTIGENAFIHCFSLTDVYYGGSESQWKQIEINNSHNCNDLLLNSTIHYNYNPTPKSGQFQYYSSFTDKTEQYTYSYDDSWFLNESTTYNHDLATMSLDMAMAAFDVGTPDRATNIKDLFEKLGFEYTDDSIVYETPGSDTIGYAIGSKTVSFGEDTFTLIAIAIRGGNYGQEWASNFTVGTTSEHAGFANAADTVVTAIKNHIQSIGVSQNLRIWITGYSRAAATTNIAAQRLNYLAKTNSIRGLSKENIFAYCFECPQTVQTSSPSYENFASNNNIFNIVNYIDIVPKVAPSKWGYSRYGITYYLPSAEQTSKYSDASKQMRAAYADILNMAKVELVDSKVLHATNQAIGQGAFFDKTADTLALYFRSQSVYVSGMYQDVMRDVGKKIGLADSQNGLLAFDMRATAFFEALIGALPAFPVRHPIVATRLSANILNLAHAHYPELCLAWMNALEGKSDFVDSRTRQLKINCPVNIEVEDSKGFPVAQIIDDTVIELEGSTIAAYIDEDDQKVIILPVDEEYTVKLIATDNGTVTYTATEYNIDTAEIERVVSYHEIDVVKGDELSGIVENLENESAVYSLYLNDSKESLKATIDQNSDDVMEYDITVTVSGNGIVSGGGTYVSGEFAKVIATPDNGEKFLGWYVDSELVSEESEYRFLVDASYNIVGRFTTNTNQSSGGNSGYYGGSGSSSTSSYQITVPTTSSGVVTVTPTSAKSGEKVTITAVPNDGYTIGSVTVTDRSGNSISVTDNGDGTYTFTMPASQVTVNATFAAIETQISWINPFTDVSESDWFYDEVAYVVQNGLMNGVGNGQFNPKGTTTRGMIMTILARLAGADTNGSNPWYQIGMEWAVREGVSDGTGPEADITREQLATMLWRYAGEPAATGDLSAFPDASKVHDWASNAMIWAVQNGIINGSDGKLNPQGNALRSEAAAMLTRYCRNIKK